MSAWKASASRSNCSLMCSSKVCGTPTGTLISVGRDRRGLHGDLQPALDLADVLGVVVEPRAIGRRRTSLRRRERLPVSESRMLPSRLRRAGALLGRAAVSEHALEHHLRIQLHRQRLGRRGPGDRVGVGAAVTLAAVAGIRARILDRELHGRHQVIPADLLRDDLIDGGARVARRRRRSSWVCSRTGTRRQPSGRRRSRREAARPSGNAGRS